MSERRPFPPSPRRLALARASGLSAASPVVTGAAAAIAGIVATAAFGRAIGARLGAVLASACAAADGTATDGPAAVAPAASTDVAHRLPLDRIAPLVLDLAMPLLIAVALVAFVAHAAQTRAVWFPRRALPGAPVLPRTSRVGFELLAALATGATCLGWLWITAPRLARLIEVPSAVPLALGGLGVTLVIAWVAIAVIDALLRRTHLARALAMTREEKREDDRLSAADPRWAAQRRSLVRGARGLAVSPGLSLSDAVARSVLVIIADDAAVAIEWSPARQPVPLRRATGRGLAATHLLALARRHRVPVHRDVALARALSDAGGPVPETHWPRVAEIVAALRIR